MNYGTLAMDLYNNGYQPVPIKPGSKRPTHDDWQHESGEAAVLDHINSRRCSWGVGINNIDAIDVDIYNKDLADKVEAYIQRIKPRFLKRVGQVPKFLVPVHPDSGLNRKMKSSWKDQDGTEHAIELLHKHQQQFVAYAIHPDTGQPYVWYSNGDPLTVPAADLDIWTADELNGLLEYFDGLCEAAGFTRQTKSGTARQGMFQGVYIPDWVPRDHMVNPLAGPTETCSIEKLKELLFLLPRKYCEEREYWFKVGGIIYDVSGGSEEGRLLFHEWSIQVLEKYDKRANDTCDLKWAGYTTKPGNAGIGTIIQWLKDEEIPIPAEEVVVAPGWQGEIIYGAEALDDASADSITLQEMLKRYVFVSKSSRVYDKERRIEIKWEEFQKVFKASLTKKGTADDPKYIETTKLWLGSRVRQTVDDITYYPDTSKDIIAQDGQVYANNYRAPYLPDLSGGKWSMDVIRPYIDHIRYLVPEKEQFKVAMRFIAHTIKYPWMRPTWALLIVTTRFGVGKGLLYDILAQVHGNHNTSIIEKKDIQSDFNGFLADSTLLMIDEVQAGWATYKEIKTLITAREMMVNQKHGAKGMRKLYCGTILFSNEENAMKIEKGDRRFHVIINHNEPKDPEYYEALYRGLYKDNNVAAHLRGFFLDLDIDPGFAMGTAPMSAAKLHMMDMTQREDELLVDQLIESKADIFHYDIVTLPLIRHYLKDEIEITHERLGNILSKYTQGSNLPKQTRIPSSVNLQGYVKALNGMVPRLKCIRNHDKWNNAGVRNQIREYLRAREVAVKPNTNANEVEESVAKLLPKD